MDWRINLGVVVLGMLLIISIVAVAGVSDSASGAASASARATSHKTWDRALLYFIAVGFGFILVEISLIQRFVLFLGHPTYALTVVVFLLLLSSGAGSVAARRWMSSGSKILPLLGLISARNRNQCGRAAVAALGRRGSAIRDQVASQRSCPSAARLPHGNAISHRFASGKDGGMGLGAQCGSQRLGSVMAMIIAIHFGLTVTLLCAAVAYLLAAAFSRTWKRRW